MRTQRRRFGPSVLDGDAQKTPLNQSLRRLVDQGVQDGQASQVQSLPCKVVEVVSPGIVTVAFAVHAPPGALPQHTIPVLAPPYIAYPIQVGDVGLAVAADVELGALSGLGGGTPNLWVKPANLTALGFVWLGTTSFTTPDPQAIVFQEPTGNCNLQVSPTGVKVAGANGNLFVEGNLGAGNGVSGSVTTVTGQVLTFTNGILTNIT